VNRLSQSVHKYGLGLSSCGCSLSATKQTHYSSVANANIKFESIKYIQLYFIIQRQQKKKATNKQTRTKDKFSQLKSFSSRLAKPETGPQIKVN